jgi:hypothetical protein
MFTAWSPVVPREMLLRLVARVSSRVFLGEEVCRDPDWLRVTREYTVDGLKAAEDLRLWPAPLRYLVHWFLPSCSRARHHVREARRIINGVLEKRRLQKSLGEKVQFEDAIEWYARLLVSYAFISADNETRAGLSARLMDGHTTRPPLNSCCPSLPSTPRRSWSPRL